MPEKVHKRFEDDPPTANSSTTKQSSINSKQSNKSTFPPNKNKRLRDGSPKKSSSATGHNKILDSTKKSFKSKKHDTNDANGTEANDRSGVINKKKKANGTEPKKTILSNDQANIRGSPQKTKSSSAKQSEPLGSSPRIIQRIPNGVEQKRKELPIWPKRGDIQLALRKNDVLILNGETGSGKSTQVPQFLHTEPWCKRQKVKIQQEDGGEREISVGGLIAITQPRRVAATSLASRVAHEMGTPMRNDAPGLVGYAVRFDSKIPKGTKIKFVTEGLLLQEMLHDPYLTRYSAVIVDEIHERSVDVDLIAGFLRKILHGDKKGRGGVPLKVVVMSATFDLGGVETFFAKPGSRSNYKPGTNFGRTLAPHMWDTEVDDDIIESDQSRRSSTHSFSTWEGFSDADENDQQAKAETTSSSSPNRSIDDNSSESKPFPPQKEDLSMDTIQSPSETAKETKVKFDTGVAVEQVPGRQYPVTVIYEANPPSDYLNLAMKTILQLHVREPMPGDILAFLTGQEEIENLKKQLEFYAEKLTKAMPRMKILPLYGSLPAAEQNEAFEPVKEKFTRKIVLATNIAETSVTVSGVRFVVDCGKSKVKQYRSRLGMESLLPKPISTVSAIQRAGRAGRESEGKCYRIYTEADFAKFSDDELPEILRSDTIEAVLKMKARGVDDVLTFPLMDAPDLAAMQRSLIQLHTMGALDNNGRLTEAGKNMAAFPLPATLGRVLIAASEPEFDVLLEAIDVISCLTTDAEIYLQPRSEEDQENIDDYRKDIHRREGDIITLLTTMQLYAAEQADRVDWCKKRLISSRAMKMAVTIRKQLRQQCSQLKLLHEKPPVDPQPFEPITPQRAELLLKAFLKAFGSKTALLGPDGSYLTTHGRNVIAIHPSSVLHGRKMEAIMFLEHVFTSKNYGKKVSSIQANWIAEAMAEG